MRRELAVYVTSMVYTSQHTHLGKPHPINDIQWKICFAPRCEFSGYQDVYYALWPNEVDLRTTGHSSETFTFLFDESFLCFKR